MKPILFNTEMVKAIQNGTKTVTRRVLKNAPNRDDLEPYHAYSSYGLIAKTNSRVYSFNPPYRIGDILYVRETFLRFDGGGYAYKADSNERSEKIRKELGYKWRPSIHMPREAARIFLRVTDVRVERLQDIKNDGAVDEGAVKRPNYTKRGDLVLHNRYRAEFSDLWNSTIKPADRAIYGWDANPWVWNIEFKRISKEEAKNGI